MLEKQSVKEDQYFNLLVYGNWGVGKTTLVGSARNVEQCQDVLFVNVEGGSKVLSGDMENIDIIKTNEWGDLEEVYEFMVSHCEIRDSASDEELLELHERYFDDPLPNRYRTVIIDSLSEIEDYCLDRIKYGDTDPADAGLIGQMASRNDWGVNNESICRVIKLFRDLPVHFLTTALSTKTVVEERQVIGPALAGKLSSKIPGYFDLVAYMYVRQVEGKNTRIVKHDIAEDAAAKNRMPDDFPELMKIDPDHKDRAMDTYFEYLSN